MFKKTIAVILAVFMLAIAGCSTDSGKSKGGADTPPAAEQQLKGEKYTVYRVPVSGEEYLIKETAIYDAPEGENREMAALNAMITTQPADSKKAVNLFPEGTKVLGVKVEKGVAYVNFNKAFAKRGQGSYNERMMVNAVVCSLTDNKDITKVKFLVEGKPLDTLGHMDMLDPITRNPDILKH